MLWCSVAGNSRFQDSDDIHGPDGPRRVHRHILTRILVEDHQNPEPAAVLGLVFDKVSAPDLPRPLGPGPLCGRGSYPLHASLLLAHLDAFLSPDASHPLRVDLKTLTPQQRRDAPIAVARMLVAEFQHLLADTPALNARLCLAIQPGSGQTQRTASSRFAPRAVLHAPLDSAPFCRRAYHFLS